MSTNRSFAWRPAIVAIAALSIFVAACGSSSGNVVADGALAKDKGVPTVPMATTIAPTTTLPSAAGKPCKPENGETKTAGEPVVLMPKGVPPTKLGISDLKEGTGTAVQVGDTITVNYIGVACSTGKVFDSSFAKGRTPFSTTLAKGSIIDGWVDGLVGMKVGGRREVVIPPAQGYGSAGNSGIAPDETLVFVVDLKDTKPTPATTTTGPAGATTAPAAATTTPATTTAPKS